MPPTKIDEFTIHANRDATRDLHRLADDLFAHDRLTLGASGHATF